MIPTLNNNKMSRKNTCETKLFQCDTCGFTTNTKFTFDHHKNIHIGHTFSCDVKDCTATFAYERSLKDHRRQIHEGGDKKTCELCKKAIRCKNMKAHVQNKHSGVEKYRYHEFPKEIKIEAVQLAEKIGTLAAAKQLNLMYATVKAWRAKMNKPKKVLKDENLQCGPRDIESKATTEAMLKCNMCQDLFQTHYQQRKHRIDVHGVIVKGSSQKRYDDNFKRKVTEYANHFNSIIDASKKFNVPEATVRRWQSLNSFLCSDCGKSFPYKTEFRRHKKIIHKYTHDEIDQIIELMELFRTDDTTVEVDAVDTPLDNGILLKQDMKKSNVVEIPDPVKYLTEVSITSVLATMCLYHLYLRNRKKEKLIWKILLSTRAKDNTSRHDPEQNKTKEHIKEDTSNCLDEKNVKNEPQFALILKGVKLENEKKFQREKKPTIINCPHCPTVVKCPSDLEKHLPLHTGERKYSCSTCGLSYKFSSSLLAHEKTHSQTEVIKCDACNTEFKRLDYLRRHVKKCSGTKTENVKSRTFICQECGKSFNMRNNFNKHTKRHMDNNNYKPRMGKKDIFKCWDCGKCFNRNSNLKVHIKRHIGVKDFSCNICDKSFVEKKPLLNHTEKVHLISGSYYSEM